MLGCARKHGSAVFLCSASKTPSLNTCSAVFVCSCVRLGAETTSVHVFGAAVRQTQAGEAEHRFQAVFGVRRPSKGPAASACASVLAGHLASGGVERERLAPARPEGPSWSTARGSVEPTILRDRTERQQFDTRQQVVQAGRQAVGRPSRCRRVAGLVRHGAGPVVAPQTEAELV